MSLHGHGLRLRGPEELLARPLEVLAHFGAAAVAPAPQVDLEATFAVGPAPEPSPEERPTARHLDLVVGRDAAGIVLRWGAAAASGVSRISPDGRDSKTVVSPGSSLPVRAFTCLLAHQLRLRGRFTLHAACVARGGRGVLVVGPSGAGKSTLTATLVRQGFSLVSDDSVLLERGPDGVHALALRRGLFLDPSSAGPTFSGARWRPCPLLEGVKQELCLDAVTREERTRPTVLVLPAVGSAPTTSFAPADVAEATYALARESRLGELDRAGAADHLGLLGAQVRPVWGHLGADVRAGDPAVAERLAALLEEGR